DAILALNRLVEAELELRRAAQPQTAADLPSHERRGAVERARGFLARLVVPEARVVDAGELQVGRDGAARQGDEADPRIVNLSAGQQLAELLADLIADAIGAVACHDDRLWTSGSGL